VPAAATNMVPANSPGIHVYWDSLVLALVIDTILWCLLYVGTPSMAAVIAKAVPAITAAWVADCMATSSAASVAGL